MKNPAMQVGRIFELRVDYLLESYFIDLQK